MFVAGVDGCHAGWIAFKVELPSRVTSVEVIDLPAWLRKRPPELDCLAIDIPIGLLDGSRACDKEARKRLRQPRGTRTQSQPRLATGMPSNIGAICATELASSSTCGCCGTDSS
jgi:predicted RNase H-like nuclease